MSGLRKAKKYDWRDSNLALFGSDIEKNVKKAAAGTEKAWEGAGEKPGLQIWRIVKFKVTDWPKEDYGKFFNGDSYIILNTYKDKESDELLHDVHFWIGEQSTQDEYGTAAYKTVELDTFLDDKPVQHREVGKFESGLFKSYFEDLVIMKGGCKCGRYKDQNLVFYGVSLLERWGSRKLFVTDGSSKIGFMGIHGQGKHQDIQARESYKHYKLHKILTLMSETPMNNSTPKQSTCKDHSKIADSGFRRVGPKEYSPRLLKFNDMGRNKVMMTECTYCKESVTPDNVYVIDNGLNLFQVNGSQSDKDERMKAAQFVVKLKAERGNCKSEVLDDDFQKTAKLPSGDPSQDSEDPEDDDFTKTIFKLSDESGSLTFTDMGAFSKSVLSSDDVFVCDNGKNCLVYVGKKASIDERRKGMQYAHNYLLKTKHPLIPVTVLLEGQKSDVFDTMF